MGYKSEWRRRAYGLFSQGLNTKEVKEHPSIQALIGHWTPQSQSNHLSAVFKDYLENNPNLYSQPDSVRNSQTADVTNTSERVTPQSFPSTSSIDEIFAKINPESYNPFGLPSPEDDSVKTIKMPIGCDNVLIISDIHFPFHSVSALTCALKYGLEQKVNTIIINGDLIDFYALSRFEKDKRLRNLQNEIDMTRDFLVKLRELFPDAHIYYKLGNHDVRWDRYIKEHAGEFEGMDEFMLDNILHLPQLRMTTIADKNLIQLGKLTIIHGHELYGSGGVNPARALYLKAGCSALMSHVHRTSEHTDRNLKDEVTGAWSIGCLSELRPNYNAGAKYNHGFGHIIVERDSTFHVNNIKIINGKIL